MKDRFRIRRILAMLMVTVVLLPLLSGCRKKERTTQEIDTLTTGIDVARYQGTIDWQQVADSDIDFAMIRVGYRGMEDGEIREDPNARYNLQEASKAGIALGVYFFSTAVTEEEAMEEAAWVADLVARYPITYPVVYDCENFNTPESRQHGMSKNARTDNAIAFLKTIESLGYEGMFYASKGDMELDNHWQVSRIEESYKIWVAQYPKEPYPATPQSSYSGIHHMWQYCTDGIVPGISQPVDMNVAYFGYDGIEPAKSKKKPEHAEPDVEAMLTFEEVDEQVTAKNETNLRDIPSQGSDSTVVRKLKNGEVVQRIAVSANGWSKLMIDGTVYYAVSSYLTTDLNSAPQEEVKKEVDDGIQTEFYAVNRQVTAKSETNLRTLPSVEHPDSKIIETLYHGDIAQCVGVSDNGWAKIKYKGTICYAVNSYLMDASSATTENEPVAASNQEEIQTQFVDVHDRMTAKKETNLRNLPSVEHPDSKVIYTIYNGDVVIRTGVNEDVGWARVEYMGQVLYCVNSFLTSAG